MKFNCGLSKADKYWERFKSTKAWLQSLQEWHYWFAWRPVRVGKKDCRWLETVERRDTRSMYPNRAADYLAGSRFSAPKWTYRAKVNKD